MRIVVLYVFLLFWAPLMGQDVKELDRRGGFKEIKLFSEVTEYPDLEYKKDIKDERYPGAKLYVGKKGSYESIGSLRIYDMEVKTYKGKVYEIIIEVEKSMGMYRGLVNAFGEPKYSHRAEKNYWNTKEIRLNYSINSRDRIVLEYYSLAMEAFRKKEQREKLQEVVDDF